MTLAALIISALANAIGLWSLNHQRLMHNWSRDKFNGPMPKLWHLRYKGKPPISTLNAEDTVKLHERLVGMEPLVLHWNGMVNPELLKALRDAIRKRPPGTGVLGK